MDNNEFYVVIDLRKLPPRVYDSFSGLVKVADKPEDVICFYEKMTLYAVENLLGLSK